MLKEIGVIIIFLLLAVFSCFAQTVPWHVAPTGSKHGLFFKSATIPAFNGAPLDTGDAIGVFYDSVGNERCGGWAIWDGPSTLITVYGKYKGSPGFETGSIFKFKIWKKATNCVSDSVSVVFAVPDGSSITASNQFLSGGISEITYLSGVPNTNIAYSKARYCKNEDNPFPMAYGIPDVIYSAVEGLMVNSITGEINLSKSSAGNYYVKFTTASCIYAYSQYITILAGAVKPDLGGDTLLCPGNAITLGKNIPSSFKRSWSTGDSLSSMLTITQPGIYWVRVTDQNGCAGRDTVLITGSSSQPNDYSVNVTQGDCLTPPKVTIFNNVPGNSILGYDLYTGTIKHGSSQSAEFYVAAGTYTIFVNEADGCKFAIPGKINVTVPENCGNVILTPYSDSNHTILNFASLVQENSVTGVSIPFNGEITIYDRNGKVVKKLKSPAFWDGLDESGVFVAMGDYYVVDENGKSFIVTVIK